MLRLPLLGSNLSLSTSLRAARRRPFKTLAPLALATSVGIANAGFEELYLAGNLPAQYAGVVPAGSFPTGAPPSGWTAWYEGGAPIPGTFIGVLNPGTEAQHAPNPAFFRIGAAEGNNAVLLYTDGDAGGPEYGVETSLGEVLRAGRRYVLRAEVGNIGSGTALATPYSTFGFYDLDGFPGYRIQLLAGGVVVAEDVDSVRPEEREWEPARLVFTPGPNHPQLGQPLGIRLVNRNQPDVPGVRGIEVDFDDVRLDVTRVRALPAPGSPAPRTWLWPMLLGLGGPWRLAAADEPGASGR